MLLDRCGTIFVMCRGRILMAGASTSLGRGSTLQYEVPGALNFMNWRVFV